jgi:hypothetical protein
MRRFLLIVAILAAVVAALALGLFFAARAVLGSDLVRSTLERQLAIRTGQPVRIASATAAIYPKIAIELEGLSVGEPAAIELASVRVMTGLGALWSRTVTDAEVAIDGGRIALPLPFPLVQAAAAPAPDAGSAGLRVESVRLISVRNVALQGAGRTVHVDLESALEGDRLDVARASARAERTRVEARGALSSLARLEGEFDATAEPLDLDELIAVASALTGGGDARPSPAAEEVPVPMRLVAAVTAPSGTYASYRFAALSAEAELVPGRIALSPLSVEAFGGSFNGRLDVDTAGAVPALRLNGRLEAMDVPQLMAASG